VKRSVSFFSPVSPVRPYVLASLMVMEPGRGRRRRLPVGPVVVASAPTFGFSPNRSGV
jgi:hypothetical protein